MKVLMVGLGSIGQRHLRNLINMYGNDIEISAYRVRRLQQTFSDDMKIRDGIKLEEEYNIKVYDDIEKALTDGQDVVFVTNITSKHIEIALAAAEHGCDIFLEKPISDSFEGINQLKDICSNNGNILYVGYQNRFHPCVKKIRDSLNKNEIGNVISVDNEFSERLTSMHTYEDYSETYMANKSMGGGPILNLQIHSLDYLQWIFGKPVSVYCITGKNSELKIDVEDYASSLYSFEQNNGNIISVYTHTDFLQYPPVHKIKIVGSKGRIEADFNKPEFTLFIDGDKKENIVFENFIRNDMFIRELKDFMNCVKNRMMPESNLEQGIIGLKMALAAKESANLNKLIVVEES